MRWSQVSFPGGSIVLFLGLIGCADSPTEPTVGHLQLREIIDLGEVVDSAGNRSPFIPVAINSQGQITGNGWGGMPLGLWQAGQITLLSGGRAIARGINDSGQVAGYSPAPGQHHWGTPFIAAEGSFTPLGLDLPIDVQGINDAGTIVGTELTGEPMLQPVRAYIWADGAIRFLEVPDASATQAVAVNDRGAVLVVGTRLICPDEYEYGECSRERIPAVMEGQAIVKLGRLRWSGVHPGEQVLDGDVDATDMNDQNDVVGADRKRACTGDQYNRRCHDHERAFLWAKGRFISLGTLPGFDNSRAVAVNNHREVVGRVSIAGESAGESHFFLYREARIYDLNAAAAELGWDLGDVRDINDEGHIVGWGRPAGSVGPLRGVLLIPDR